MGADVAQRARAGVFLLQAPRQRHLRVDEPVLPVGGAHLVDRAHGAFGDEVAEEGDGRNAAVGEADHRPDAPGSRPLGGFGHRFGFRHRVGERLFAQNVLPGLQRGDRDLGVGVAGGDDVDDVDIVAGDHFPPVCG